MAVDLGVSPRRGLRRLASVTHRPRHVARRVRHPEPPAAADPGTDSEGQSSALNAKLEAAAEELLRVKAKLTASQKRQVDIKKRLEDAQLSLLRLSAVVSNIAAARYKGSQLGVLDGLITGRAPGRSSPAGRRGRAVHGLARRRPASAPYRQAQDDAKRTRTC